MRKFYLFVVAWAGTVLTLGGLLAGDARGQNFAGTVGAGGNSSAGEASAGAVEQPLGRADTVLKEERADTETADDPFAFLESGPASSAAETTQTPQQPSAAEQNQGSGEPSLENGAGIPDFVRLLSHYTLGVDDIVEIAVLRHPEVSGQYLINSEGNIQYEFVGDIHVEGMTKDDLRDALVERLTSYIISPEVTVKITGYNSKIVYVIGEVGSPGKIFMRGDTITVREALVQAGLPLLSAKAGDSRVITPSADGNPQVRKVNVARLLYEGDLREDLVMKPGDTLYVPPTFLAKTMRVLQPIASPIGTAAGTGRTVTTGF